MAAAPSRSLSLSMQLGSSHYRGHDIDDDATIPVTANPARSRPARAPPVPLPVHLSRQQRPRRSLAEDRLPLSRTVSSGATLVANRFINSRRSASHILEWEYHPALAGSKASRVFSRYYRYLTRQAEALSTDFPAEALLQELTDLEREKVKQLYVARINHINKWVIPDCLVRTRFCLCLLEIVGVIVLALFIAALAITGGRQQGLMQAAEVSLIVILLMAAMTMNYARVRCYFIFTLIR